MTELLQATALMFVAFTGYGRIATLGEEVAEPRRTIPIAVIATLGVTMLLYAAVAAVALDAKLVSRVTNSMMLASTSAGLRSPSPRLSA